MLQVLLLDGESSFATAVAWCLRSTPEVNVHVLSREANAPLKRSNCPASFHHHQAADDQEYLEQIELTADRVDADICVAVDEPAIRLVARHAASLAKVRPFAPVPTIDSLDIAADKWALAEFLRAEGLPHPNSRLCVPFPEIEEPLRELDFPVLLKPSRGGFGQGIVQFDDAASLTTHVRTRNLGSPCIVQTMTTGWDIDCSVLCDNGKVLAHTIQKGFGPAPALYRPAGAVEFLHHEETISLAKRLMAALHWTGIAHIDLRYSEQDQQLQVIEINPRFWGSVLGSHRAGVNFPHFACLAGLGKAFPAPDFRECRYVAGQAALKYWMHGRIGERHAGFRFAETSWPNILQDPGPFVSEILNSGKQTLESARRTYDRRARRRPRRTPFWSSVRSSRQPLRREASDAKATAQIDGDRRLSDLVFVVFSDDWGRHPSSCQHLFRRIVPQAQVLWVNTVGLRVPRLTVHDINRGLQVVGSWLRPAGRAKETAAAAQEGSLRAPAPDVLRPAMWPSFRSRWLATVNQWLLSRAVTRALAETAIDKRAILVSTLPIVPRLFRESRFARTVYYCVDDFTEWRGIDGGAMRRMEQDTLTGCDLLIATSTPILESRGPLSRRSVLLTHGVDTAHFATATPDPNSPLATLPHPIVGMFGVFDQRINANILIAAARALPTATFAVVGPVVDREAGEFREVPNLHFLGRMPYDKLPGHVAHFDVCILPYVVDETTHSINPLKLKEYLATGKPVVATPLPEAARLGGYLTLVPPERFAAEVKRAALDPPPPAPGLTEFLAGESWEAKADQFLEEILKDV